MESGGRAPVLPPPAGSALLPAQRVPCLIRYGRHRASRRLLILRLAPVTILRRGQQQGRYSPQNAGSSEGQDHRADRSVGQRSGYGLGDEGSRLVVADECWNSLLSEASRNRLKADKPAAVWLDSAEHIEALLESWRFMIASRSAWARRAKTPGRGARTGPGGKDRAGGQGAPGSGPRTGRGR